VRAWTVHTEPIPIARFWGSTAEALSEKTLLRREMTCPPREISQSELPLRAHKDP